jgi:hypothetical protein
MKVADTPELVASAVVNAATEANPHRRYAAGRTAQQVSLLSALRSRVGVRPEPAEADALTGIADDGEQSCGSSG